jgi:sulfur carrier protein ThiS
MSPSTASRSNCRRPQTVATLLEARGLAGKRSPLSATARSCPGAGMPRRLLANGDQIEIVVAVGGG